MAWLAGLESKGAAAPHHPPTPPGCVRAGEPGVQGAAGEAAGAGAPAAHHHGGHKARLLVPDAAARGRPGHERLLHALRPPHRGGAPPAPAHLDAALRSLSSAEPCVWVVPTA